MPLFVFFLILRIIVFCHTCMVHYPHYIFIHFGLQNNDTPTTMVNNEKNHVIHIYSVNYYPSQQE